MKLTKHTHFLQSYVCDLHFLPWWPQYQCWGWYFCQFGRNHIWWPQLFQRRFSCGIPIQKWKCIGQWDTTVFYCLIILFCLDWNKNTTTLKIEARVLVKCHVLNGDDVEWVNYYYLFGYFLWNSLYRTVTSDTDKPVKKHDGNVCIWSCAKWYNSNCQSNCINTFFLIKVFGIYGSHDLHLLPRTQYMTTAKAQRFLRADTVPFSESEKIKRIRLVLKKCILLSKCIQITYRGLPTKEIHLTMSAMARDSVMPPSALIQLANLGSLSKSAEKVIKGIMIHDQRSSG